MPDTGIEMHDIALGIQEIGLQAFAARINASYMSQWEEMGLYDEGLDSWAQAFRQALDRTLAAGGRFHFDLTGLDITDALAGDPDFWVGRYTAWELQQIVRNEAWFANTIFYRDGQRLNAEQVAGLGIVPPDTSGQ